tara:strand:+ start:1882 stop:2004 length:123 start_codon:yes stop_codon:yes gene_type:complete
MDNYIILDSEFDNEESLFDQLTNELNAKYLDQSGESEYDS